MAKSLRLQDFLHSGNYKGPSVSDRSFGVELPSLTPPTPPQGQSHSSAVTLAGNSQLVGSPISSSPNYQPAREVVSPPQFEVSANISADDQSHFGDNDQLAADSQFHCTHSSWNLDSTPSKRLRHTSDSLLALKAPVAATKKLKPDTVFQALCDWRERTHRKLALSQEEYCIFYMGAWIALQHGVTTVPQAIHHAERVVSEAGTTIFGLEKIGVRTYTPYYDNDGSKRKVDSLLLQTIQENVWDVLKTCMPLNRLEHDGTWASEQDSPAKRKCYCTLADFQKHVQKFERREHRDYGPMFGRRALNIQKYLV
mmetsp:Transcript_15972/g.25591  ORF Transcript_15972/g.25591 Transcript_15972/m.25591 type:complete len:311 (+) Transcript_15972:583-1515(+)